MFSIKGGHRQAGHERQRSRLAAMLFGREQIQDLAARNAKTLHFEETLPWLVGNSKLSPARAPDECGAAAAIRNSRRRHLGRLGERFRTDPPLPASDPRGGAAPGMSPDLR